MSIVPPYSQLQIFLLDFYWGLSKTSWGLPIYAEVSSRAIPFHCKESCCFCLPAHIAALWGKTDSVHLNYRRKCHFAWSFFGSAAEQNHTCLLSVMHLLHLSLVSKIKMWCWWFRTSAQFQAHEKVDMERDWTGEAMLNFWTPTRRCNSRLSKYQIHGTYLLQRNWSFNQEGWVIPAILGPGTERESLYQIK